MTFIANPCYASNKADHALNIIKRFAKDAYTPEQKAWVIDQVTRALTSCPMVIKPVTTSRGENLEFELQGECNEYLVIANDPRWDRGIPV